MTRISASYCKQRMDLLWWIGKDTIWGIDSLMTRLSDPVALWITVQSLFMSMSRLDRISSGPMMRRHFKVCKSQTRIVLSREPVISLYLNQD